MDLIAEIGWNHMGDMNFAETMIKAAKNAGATHAKFQTWSEKDLKAALGTQTADEIFIKKLN